MVVKLTVTVRLVENKVNSHVGSLIDSNVTRKYTMPGTSRKTGNITLPMSTNTDIVGDSFCPVEEAIPRPSAPIDALALPACVDKDGEGRELKDMTQNHVSFHSQRINTV